jgi:hypothetical protein
MTAWNLRRQRIACATCATSFDDGARYFSVLTTQAGELARSDFCQRCWSRPARQPTLLVAHAAPRKTADAESRALEAFCRARGRKDKRVELRFLFCLLLMRQRRLVVRMTAGHRRFRGLAPPEEFGDPVRLHARADGGLREELRAFFPGRDPLKWRTARAG